MAETTAAIPKVVAASETARPQTEAVAAPKTPDASAQQKKGVAQTLSNLYRKTGSARVVMERLAAVARGETPSQNTTGIAGETAASGNRNEVSDDGVMQAEEVARQRQEQLAGAAQEEEPAGEATNEQNQEGEQVESTEPIENNDGQRQETREQQVLLTQEQVQKMIEDALAKQAEKYEQALKQDREAVKLMMERMMEAVNKKEQREKIFEWLKAFLKGFVVGAVVQVKDVGVEELSKPEQNAPR